MTITSLFQLSVQCGMLVIMLCVFVCTFLSSYYSEFQQKEVQDFARFNGIVSVTTPEMSSHLAAKVSISCCLSMY